MLGPGLADQFQQHRIKHTLKIRLQVRRNQTLSPALLYYLIRRFYGDFVERFQVIFIPLSVDLLGGVVFHRFGGEDLLGDLQDFIKILEKVLGFCTI